MNTSYDSPALSTQSTHYPAEWNGNVPKKIRMLSSVKSDIPFVQMRCAAQMEYAAYVNSHGALSAIINDDDMLGLKPGEFEVIEWHDE